jgi:hypothetical protein
VVVVLRVKALPDVVGASNDSVRGRRFLLGGVVEKSRVTFNPCGLVFQVKTQIQLVELDRITVT